MLTKTDRSAALSTKDLTRSRRLTEKYEKDVEHWEKLLQQIGYK